MTVEESDPATVGLERNPVHDTIGLESCAVCDREYFVF